MLAIVDGYFCKQNVCEPCSKATKHQVVMLPVVTTNPISCSAYICPMCLRKIGTQGQDKMLTRYAP